MSCTVMYQPYAMSYSSSCDRTSSSDKAPSPPDSLASETSSYNSPGPGPMSVGTTPSSHSSAASNSQSSRRPLTPIAATATIVTSRSSLSSSAVSARSSSLTESLPLSLSHAHEESSSSHHHHHSSPSTSSHHSHSSHPSHLGQSHRAAHYLSANCVVFVNYNGDVSRVVDEHFSRALSAAYATDQSSTSKGSPMSKRNFPPSFWNSNYQPSKPLASYGAAAEFYGAAVDYGASIPTLAHHHQTDPWHYPLPPPHQSYHRPTEIPYPPMPSSSRFNAAQYGSFLLAGAASSGAGRFPVIPGSSQCSVKGDNGGWGGGRYHHHHDSLSDLHLADYSAAAAAAHYSNMTAGLETSVPDASKDLYWF